MVSVMRSPTTLPVVAVASGKGGVGKTSVAVGLARRLGSVGCRVGLVDADLYGPDVPRMLGIRRDIPAASVTVANWGGRSRAADLQAAEVDGIKVASLGFLIGGNQGISVGAPIGALLLRRLVCDTDWGELDGFVIDLPPGTGEIHQSLLGIFDRIAVLLVVTPAEVAHLDTSRALTVLNTAHATVLGGVENMSYLRCGHCGERMALHPDTPADRTIWSRGVPKLASLPFRPDGVIPDAELDAVVAVAQRYFRVDGDPPRDGR